jgi:hypothetical protein
MPDTSTKLPKSESQSESSVSGTRTEISQHSDGPGIEAASNDNKNTVVNGTLNDQAIIKPSSTTQ